MRKKPEPKPLDYSRPLKRVAHETFALAVASGKTQHAAYIEAYPHAARWKNANAVDPKASALAGKVAARISHLRERSTNAKVCGLIERKELLSRIARAKVTDFGELGAAGYVPSIGPETDAYAIKKIKSRIVTDGTGDGKGDSVIVEVELEDRKGAIDLLNKMDGSYAAEKQDVRVSGTVTVADIAAAIAEKTGKIGGPA